MLRDKVIGNKEKFLLSIGIILVVLALILISYDKVKLIKEQVISEIALQKYLEKQNEKEELPNDSTDENDDSDVEVDTEYVEGDENSNVSTPSDKTEIITKNYIGFLEIDKISLNAGLVSKESYYNHVDRNIEILQVSDYPDKEKGNVILAAHSGTSSISYFKNLYQLSVGDIAKIYYKNVIYNYKIVSIYNVPKTGSLRIYRDLEKSTLTLITCTKNSKTEQTVYILELIDKLEDGEK